MVANRVQNWHDVWSSNPSSAAGSIPPNSKHLIMKVYVLQQPKKTAEDQSLQKQDQLVHLDFFFFCLLSVCILDRPSQFSYLIITFPPDSHACRHALLNICEHEKKKKSPFILRFSSRFLNLEEKKKMFIQEFFLSYSSSVNTNRPSGNLHYFPGKTIFMWE